MKFKIVKNFQGENRAPHACQIEVVEPISGEEIIGYSTFDPKLLVASDPKREGYGNVYEHLKCVLCCQLQVTRKEKGMATNFDTIM